MSSWLGLFQLRLIESAVSNLNESYLTTGENNSSKSVPSCCEKPLATSLALYRVICPAESFFILYTHLQSTILRLESMGTIVQTFCFFINLSSVCIAVIHRGASVQEVACLNILGSYSLTARAVANNVLECCFSLSADWSMSWLVGLGGATEDK